MENRKAKIKFQRLHPDAKLPKRGSEKAAGLDLCSVDDISIDPGARLPVRTGLAVAIPSGYYGRVAPRSGLAMNHGVDILAGVIDSDYRGEIFCILINFGDEPVKLMSGSRVAQLIVEAIIMPDAEWVNTLDTTDRGGRGFGSTNDES